MIINELSEIRNMLGSIIGDIVGSIYEYHNIKTKDFALFSEKDNFTDDTILTIATAKWILEGASQSDSEQYYFRYGTYPFENQTDGRFGKAQRTALPENERGKVLFLRQKRRFLALQQIYRRFLYVFGRLAVRYGRIGQGVRRISETSCRLSRERAVYIHTAFS